MSEDPYQKGYRQGREDFEQGKKAQPNKLRNLQYLVFGGKKVNEEFLQGYKEGYKETMKKSLRKEGSQSGKGMSKHPHAKNEVQQSSPQRRERLEQSRSRLRDTPENEPEY